MVMSFLHPVFIYLMLPVTLILFYFIMTGAKESFVMFEPRVLDKLRFQNKSLSRNAREVLFLIAFIFMIIALAQPVIKEGEVVVEAKSADILIGIDISDSMKAEDRFPNRLDFAKAKAIELIKQAPHNRIGVLAFAKHDYIVSPLSFDHSSVAFLLSKVQTNNITEKGTRLDSMLSSAIAMLEHAKQKNLLLFTDGGDVEDLSQEIALAKENGLRLFIIGVGTEQGSPVRTAAGDFVKHEGKILISRLNPEIKELATQTGGVYIESVLGEDDIKAMLKEIESMTEKSTMKEETIAQYIQLFYYPLALAVFFLLLAFSSVPKSVAKSLVLLGFVVFSIPDARAGLLDFQKLQNAKEAYAQEDYAKSRSIYEEFALQSPEAVYNLANSLYKDKEYEKALKVFDKVKTDNPDLKAKVLHNSGNTHVQLKQYKEALSAYEKSLELKEDKETRENYEAVKKFLEEEQEKKDNQEQQDENKQDDKDSEDKKEKDQGNNAQDPHSKDQSQEQKDQEEKQDKDASSKDKEQDSQQKSDKQQSEEEKKQEASGDEQKEQDKSSTAEQKSEEKKQEQSKSDEQKEEANAASKDMPVSMQNMSDLEAKKWLNVIKKSQKGHLYKMEDFEHKEDENEKPW
jgi:Ca-activated chloride channel family protein